MRSSLIRRRWRLPLASLCLAVLPLAAAADSPVRPAVRTAVPVVAVPNAPAAASRLQTMQFTDTGTRTVSVSGDFNNDGYPDLVLGNPTYTNGQSQEGSVDVYYGSPTGLATVRSFHFETNVVTGFVGSSPTVADVNGDGYADLIVGAYNYSKPGGEPYTGAIFVFFGSANGLADQPSQVLYGLSGAMYSYFGNSIRKLGDFNGDGYADIVVSAQAYNNKGVLQVFVGGPGGLVATPYRVIQAPTGETNFGGVFETGDTNGDGFVDIIVARRGNASAGSGAVRIYRGSASGPATAPSETIVGGNPGDNFGSSLAFLGDLNGDGFGDLAIAAPTAPIDGISTGYINVYYGSAGGYGASTRSPQTLDGTAAPGGFQGFGGRMVGGRDFNGDGYTDLVIGTGFESLPTLTTDPFPGHLWVMRGGASGVQVADPLLQIEGTPGSVDSVGYGPLDIADLNRDGRSDLITGAPVTVVVGTPAPYRLRIYYGLDRR